MTHKIILLNKSFQLMILLGIVSSSTNCLIDNANSVVMNLATENNQQCGSADPHNLSNGVSVEYGLGRPFTPSDFTGKQDDPLDLPMEYGIQGGHHVDISLRFTGEINPDLININMDLSVSPPFNDVYYGLHNTQGWYLLFPQDKEEAGCYFHQARIFLFDLEGRPVEPLDVAMLHGLSAQLYIKLSTETADYEWIAIGNLRNAVNDQ